MLRRRRQPPSREGAVSPPTPACAIGVVLGISATEIGSTATDWELASAKVWVTATKFSSATTQFPSAATEIRITWTRNCIMKAPFHIAPQST